MDDKMTFKDYIKNPSGGRTMMARERQIAQQVYSDKYGKMMLRVGGNIGYTLFKKDQSRYVIWFKMPSEGTNDLFYDVVVEFHTKDHAVEASKNLDDYAIKFFSNDPNFTFTFAYIFNQKKMIVEELKNKLGKEALKTNPAKTNPNGVVGYVKSLYFAYLFMDSHGLFNKLSWLNAMNLTQMKNSFNQNVMTFEKKLIQAQKLKKIDKANKNGSVHISNPDDLGEIDFKKGQHEIQVQKVQQAQKVSKISPIKKVGYVSKVKRTR